MHIVGASFYTSKYPSSFSELLNMLHFWLSASEFLYSLMYTWQWQSLLCLYIELFSNTAVALQCMFYGTSWSWQFVLMRYSIFPAYHVCIYFLLLKVFVSILSKSATKTHPRYFYSKAFTIRLQKHWIKLYVLSSCHILTIAKYGLRCFGKQPYSF